MAARWGVVENLDTVSIQNRLLLPALAIRSPATQPPRSLTGSEFQAKGRTAPPDGDGPGDSERRQPVSEGTTASSSHTSSWATLTGQRHTASYRRCCAA